MSLINDKIYYLGVDDFITDIFESQYPIKNGVSYNSYAIIDEKIAIMDTVDIKFKDEWLANIKKCLNGKNPDYLVVLHMEPDHSAAIASFIEEYPNSILVGNTKTFNMIGSFFPTLEIKNKVVVNDKDVLTLGEYKLNFIFAPMVHWPEVMVAYEQTTKTLFSADAFGKFGALSVEDNWLDEARRYYIGIVGKYGVQVQALLKKASSLEIERILPLHGPILTSNLGYYLSYYDKWSKYEAEEDGILIVYSSIYGNTKKAAEKLYEKLISQNKKVEIYDAARTDLFLLVGLAFKYTKLVLASPTYNATYFPVIGEFINMLVDRNYQNRTVAFIENGSWAPMAKKAMLNKISVCKNLNILEESVKVISALNEDSLAQIEVLSKAL